MDSQRKVRTDDSGRTDGNLVLVLVHQGDQEIFVVSERNQFFRTSRGTFGKQNSTLTEIVRSLKSHTDCPRIHIGDSHETNLERFTQIRSTKCCSQCHRFISVKMYAQRVRLEMFAKKTLNFRNTNTTSDDLQKIDILGSKICFSQAILSRYLCCIRAHSFERLK